jgi:hypothetical protein
MRSSAWLVIASGFAAAALVAGCSGSTATLTPAGTRPPPDASRLPAPFAPLQFDTLVIGPQVTFGYQCRPGIVTSKNEIPSSRPRAGERAPHGVFPATGGCDPAAGYPAVSPYPTPSASPPAPLASASLATAQITAPAAGLTLPSVAGWTGALAFPACASGTCDAGTSAGSIALSVLPGTSAATYTFALNFTNTGPEHLSAPTPSPAEHPAPHIWTLYGPRQSTTVATPGPPVTTFLSGAPITLGFPSLAVTVPAGSGIVPGSLQLSVSQVLTPPVYQIQIERRSAAGDFLPIPLQTNATPYRPYAATATTAQFALPSRPFAFQTDFTTYVFSLATAP